MKKIFLYTAAVAMTMLASCSEDESLDVRPAQGITFNTSVGQATRANVMDLDGLKTAGFNVSAFRYSGTGADKKVSDKVHFDNLTVGWTGSAWANDLRYWPSSSEKTVVGGTSYETTGLEFLAYSPTALNEGASASYANGDMTISDFAPAATAATQKDLSVAYAADQTEAVSGVSGVGLTFKHSLAQVEVKARNYASDLKIDIQSVKLCNVVGTGTMTLGATSITPSWTMGATCDPDSVPFKYATADLTGATLVSTATEATSFHTNGDYFMLLPQTSPVWQNASETADNASGAYFLVTCKIYDQEAGNTHYRFGVGTASTWGTVAIPLVANGGAGKMKWEAGKKYTYTLEFFKDGGGAGYTPPTPEGETPSGDEGQSVTPGKVTFSTSISVDDWGEGGSYTWPEEEATPDPNLLSGDFSVSATKKVKFTKGNLYYSSTDSQYHLESAQNVTFRTLGQTNYTAAHVCHFYWANATDWQTTGKEPWASTYSYSSQSGSDKFFCGEENKMTVDDSPGLYALSGGNNGEWYYLLNSRPNASSLRKNGVSVTTSAGTVANCAVIAPDGYDYTAHPLQTSYTAEEWAAAEALGLVCLPAAGTRFNSQLNLQGTDGDYWASGVYSENVVYTNVLFIQSTYFNLNCAERYWCYSIRLVKTVE